MSEMLDKIKDLLNQPESEVEFPVEEQKLPLEEAVTKALYHLDEIRIYGTYGRAGECAREATEAYDTIKALWEKFQEQNAIMEALQKPEAHNDTGYA